MRLECFGVIAFSVFFSCAFDASLVLCEPPDAEVESGPVRSGLIEWRAVLKQRGLEPGYKISVSSSGTVRIERGVDRGSNWKLVKEGNLPAKRASEVVATVGRMLKSFKFDDGAADEGSDARLVLSLQSKSRSMEIEWDFEDSRKLGMHALLNDFVQIIDSEVPGTDVGYITR